jgi:hypothetical protein
MCQLGWVDCLRTEAPEHAVPIPKRLRKITPGRARTHDPQHNFHEHPIVAPGGAFLVRSTYDQRRHPLPRPVAQNQPLHHTQDCLPKSSLESDLLLKGSTNSSYSYEHAIWNPEDFRRIYQSAIPIYLLPCVVPLFFYLAINWEGYCRSMVGSVSTVTSLSAKIRIASSRGVAKMP